MKLEIFEYFDRLRAVPFDSNFINFWSNFGKVLIKNQIYFSSQTNNLYGIEY